MNELSHHSVRFGQTDPWPVCSSFFSHIWPLSGVVSRNLASPVFADVAESYGLRPRLSRGLAVARPMPETPPMMMYAFAENRQDMISPRAEPHWVSVRQGGEYDKVEEMIISSLSRKRERGSSLWPSPCYGHLLEDMC